LFVVACPNAAVDTVKESSKKSNDRRTL